VGLGGVQFEMYTPIRPVRDALTKH
jgi:hypothetical protein